MENAAAQASPVSGGGKEGRSMKVGIVGCGSVAQIHAQALAVTEGVRLFACADIVPERAEKMALAYGAKAYADFHEMLDAEALDALHITTPHSLHVPMAEAAASRGVAVFMEKPPAVTPAQWERLSALEGVVPVGICFQNRYNGATRALSERLAAGEAGRVLGARAFVTWRRDAAYYTQSGWRGAWATEGGGALINQAIHTLDLLVYLLGSPDTWQASMHNRRLGGVIEVEDTVEAWIGFGDVPALFYATTAHCADAPVLLEIVCEKAVYRIEGTALTCRFADGRVETPPLDEEKALGKGYWGNGHVPCIRDFYGCLKTGGRFPIGIADVRDTVRLMLGLYAAGGMRPPQGHTKEG